MASCSPEPLLAHWGNRVHLYPKHLCRENLTQQAGQSTLWTLEKDRQGEVFIGTSLGKSGDPSFSSLFMLAVFSKLSKSEKSKTLLLSHLLRKTSQEQFCCS